MKRQSQAILMTAGLLLVLFAVGWNLPVPYVILSPGTTVNVLGADGDDQPHIEIDGATQYPDDGSLRMVTVFVTRPDTEVSLVEAMWTWFLGRDELLPREIIYPEPTTQDEETARSAAQMISSQDNAIAAALTELGYDFTTRVGVVGVAPDSAAEGALKERDWILAVDGTAVRSAKQVVRLVGAHEPGEAITITVERDGRTIDKKIVLGSRQDDPSAAYLGIVPGTGYDFPIDVRVNIDSNIGGPSAGLVLALAIYDNLTPGSLVGDLSVAGTGDISADGSVGPIGGIAEKLKAAVRDGADVFLVPPGNCPDILDGSNPEGLTLVKASTLTSALASIEALERDPNAEVPRCTR